MALESIEPTEMITGVRPMDKLASGGKRLNLAIIGIEAWLSNV